MKKKHLCKVKFCRSPKDKKDCYCGKHRKRLQLEKDPVAYTYNARKSNAKRRGKSFELTLEEFREFCERTDYMNLKGREASCASMDRIRAQEGYSIDNLQVLTVSENAIKRHEEDYPF